MQCLCASPAWCILNINIANKNVKRRKSEELNWNKNQKKKNVETTFCPTSKRVSCYFLRFFFLGFISLSTILFKRSFRIHLLHLFLSFHSHCNRKWFSRLIRKYWKSECVIKSTHRFKKHKQQNIHQKNTGGGEEKRRNESTINSILMFATCQSFKWAICDDYSDFCILFNKKKKKERKKIAIVYSILCSSHFVLSRSFSLSFHCECIHVCGAKFKWFFSLF